MMIERKDKQLATAASILDKKGPEWKTHLIVENGNINATNGHCVFRMPDGELDPGFYQVVKRNKSNVQFIRAGSLDGYFYPDLDAVLDPNTGKVEFNDIPNTTNPDGLYFYTVQAVGSPFAYKYVSAITAFCGETFTRAYNTGENTPLVFDGPRRQAAVMPMVLP